MLEINFRPETPAERQAALQLMAALARAEPGPEQARTKPWQAAVELHDGPNGAAPEPPAAAPSEEPLEAAGDDIPWPPSGEPERTYSRSDVVEALQDYARTNGAMALKEVLDQFGARRVSDLEPADYPEVMMIARGELG